MVSHLAYRPAVTLLNRMRHEAADTKTPVRTAAEVVEREGSAMQTTFDPWATQVFAGAGLTPEGQPATAAPPQEADVAMRLPQTTVVQAMTRDHRDQREDLRMEAEAATAFYQDPGHTINVSLDDVGVKKQKPSGRAPGTPAKERRESVHNTIAHGESPQHGRSRINGLGTEAVLRLLIALLLHHEMLSDYSGPFFVDGART